MSLSEEDLIEARELGEMMRSPGWTWIVKRIDATIEDATKKLLLERDHLKMIGLQERIFAFTKLKQYPHEFVETVLKQEKEATAEAIGD